VANRKTDAVTNSSQVRDLAKFDLRDAALPVIATDVLFICALENEVGDYTFESVRAKVQGGERAKQVTNGRPSMAQRTCLAGRFARTGTVLKDNPWVHDGMCTVVACVGLVLRGSLFMWDRVFDPVRPDKARRLVLMGSHRLRPSISGWEGLSSFRSTRPGSLDSSGQAPNRPHTILQPRTFP